MKHIKTSLTLLLLVCTGAFADQAQTAPAAKAPKTEQTQPSTMTDKQKTSYSIGLNIGLNLHDQEVQVDTTALLKGIQDGLANAKPALSEAEIRAVLMTLQKQIADRQETRKKDLATKNQTEADTFLAANKTKPGVVTLPSGLQYKIITEGKGPKPLATDTVTTHYKGTFLDGKQFDSSYDRGEPASFTVNGVIPGWTEALQLMAVGSKWQLFVPAKLAYGENGFQNVIPPNAALLFEVELISIQPKKAQEEPKKQ
jgi:FKBP-type peptidyl-prolyl cis-trans isomerase FklB